MNATRQERLEYLELVLGELQWYNKVELILEYHEVKRLSAPGWTIEKTAQILGRSVPAIDKDFRLARAIRANPELRKCRNRADAEETNRGGTKQPKDNHSRGVSRLL